MYAYVWTRYRSPFKICKNIHNSKLQNKWTIPERRRYDGSMRGELIFLAILAACCLSCLDRAEGFVTVYHSLLHFRNIKVTRTHTHTQPPSLPLIKVFVVTLRSEVWNEVSSLCKSRGQNQTLCSSGRQGLQSHQSCGICSYCWLFYLHAKPIFYLSLWALTFFYLVPYVVLIPTSCW